MIIIAISLMVMERRVEQVATTRAALSVGLTPIYYLVSRPVQYFDKLKTALTSHGALIDENKHLKTEQLFLKTQLQRMLAIESENDYLKSLFQFSKKIKEKTAIAELLAVSSEPYVHQVTLDKGKAGKVYRGQPVLDANGVMGQVIEVGQATSRVLLINDPHSGVAVQSSRNSIRAVAVGDSGSGKIRLQHLPHTSDVKVGDVFLTSGLGDRYPAGYPVGIVSEVDKDPAQQFAKIILDPSARINSSRQVLLIWTKQHA